eukprot:13781626-Alexandrium_andersonii.AAC.1
MFATVCCVHTPGGLPPLWPPPTTPPARAGSAFCGGTVAHLREPRSKPLQTAARICNAYCTSI